MKFQDKAGGKILSVLVGMLLLACAGDAGAQTRPRIVNGDGPGSWNPEQALGQQFNKATDIFDRGIAFMDAGLMHMSGVEDYGMIGQRTPYCRHKLWGDLRWVLLWIGMPPGPWGANVVTADYGIVDRSMFYNVIESVGARLGEGGLGISFTDWEAKDYAISRLKGSARTASNRPMIAISTLEESWPEGYYGDAETFSGSGEFTETPGERHWPGPWAQDPDPASPTFGQPVFNKFVSSKDAFYIMDDKYNGIRATDDTGVGAPVGFDVECSMYSYAAPIYEDIVFFNYNVIFRDNIPDEDPTRQFYNGPIDNANIGFVFDPDLPGANPDNEQVQPWAIDDFAYLDTNPDVNALIMYDKRGWTEDLGGRASYFQGPVSLYGVIWLKTPADIGVTEFHFVDQDDGITQTDVGPHFEEVMYAIGSGRTDLMKNQHEYRLYFHQDPSHPDYPHIDNLDSLIVYNEYDQAGNPYPPFNDYPACNDRPDVWFTMAGSPLTLTPGDTFPLHVAFMGADDNPGPLDPDFYDFPINTPGGYRADGALVDPHDRFTDMYRNIAMAYDLYGRAFQGSGPPATPTLSVKGTLLQEGNEEPYYRGEPGRVTLYWDNMAEYSQDLVTKRFDFEGYRLWKTIYNPNKIVQEFELLMQWDVIDGVTGWDPFLLAEFNARAKKDDREIQITAWLGDDTGIVNSYVDTDVRNGLTYDYALTAYDLYDSLFFSPTSETFRGKSPKLKQYVRVIPGFQPAGFADAAVDSVFERVSGYGTGTLELEVIDDIAVTGHTYTVTFAPDTTVGVVMNVVDNDLGETVLENYPGVFRKSDVDAGTVVPFFTTYFDGVGLKIVNNDLITFKDQSWATIQNDSTWWTITELTPSLNPIQAFYELRYLGGAADSNFTGVSKTQKSVPFQIWNVTDTSGSYQVKMKFTGHPFRAWESGQAITFYEPDVANPGQYIQTWTTTVSFPDSGDIASIDTSVTPPDTVFSMPLDPVPGDVFRWRTEMGFDARDQFRFSTTKAGIEEAEIDMGKIRVVPNPYIVASDVELYTRSNQWTRHEIRFINLPDECTIDIYTVSADRIKTIHHDSPYFGEATWDLLTEENLEISYGMYIYVVKTPDGKKRIGKFIVVK